MIDAAYVEAIAGSDAVAIVSSTDWIQVPSSRLIYDQNNQLIENKGFYEGNDSKVTITCNIAAKGIQIDIAYADTISDADKALIQKDADKIKIEAVDQLATIRGQIKLFKETFGYNDQTYQKLFEDKTVYAEGTIKIAIEVTNCSGLQNSNDSADESYITYSITPAYQAVIYKDQAVYKEGSLEITPEMFRSSKGKLDVTLPVCGNYTPKLITHYDTDTEEIYNQFVLSGGEDTFEYNEADKTVHFVIEHCSSVKIEGKCGNVNTGVTGSNTGLIVAGIILVAVIALIVFLIWRRKQNTTDNEE